MFMMDKVPANVTSASSKNLASFLIAYLQSLPVSLFEDLNWLKYWGLITFYGFTWTILGLAFYSCYLSIRTEYVSLFVALRFETYRRILI